MGTSISDEPVASTFMVSAFETQASTFQTAPL
jgi:hypothetical protein